MARCKGCGQVCTCRVVGSDCIEVTGNGQENRPYTVAPILSEDVGNSVECRDDGLFVGAEIVAGLFTGPGIDGDGTAPSPITPDPPFVRVFGSIASAAHNSTSTATSRTVGADTHGMTSGVVHGAGFLRCRLPGIYTVNLRARVSPSESASGDVMLTIVGDPAFDYYGVYPQTNHQLEGLATGATLELNAHGVELDEDDEFEPRFENLMGTTVSWTWELTALWERPLPS